MKGIFGGFSRSAEVRRRVEQCVESRSPDACKYAEGNWLLYSSGVDTSLETTFEGRRDRVRLVEGCSAISGPWSDQQDSAEAVLKGLTAFVDTTQAKITLISSSNGIYPLYFCVFAEGFVFGSHQAILAKVRSSDVDRVGVQEYLLNGFTFGHRTLFRDIRQLLPGQQLTYDSSSGIAKISEYSKFGVPYTDKDDEIHAESAAWRRLEHVAQESFSMEARVGLMLSAGWDSRTLLAALSQEARAKTLCYSHGDKACREISLAAQIATDAGVPLNVAGLDSFDYGVEKLSAYFESHETVLFPHWHSAGEILLQQGVGIATAGIFGEVIGGHYGSSATLHGMRKAAAVFGELIGVSFAREPSTVDQHLIATLLAPSTLDQHWSVEDQWHDQQAGVLNEIQFDVENELTRLQGRGVTENRTLIEVFTTEHRGARYIAKQLTSMAASLKVTAPFADPTFLRQATVIPAVERVHNRLNREYLKRRERNLLEFPMAATLIKAKHPLLAQETSRAARKVMERAAFSRLMSLSREARRPHAGWANFQFLGQQSAFYDWVDSLSYEAWDRGKMRSVIENVTDSRGDAINLHPYYDMLLKIVTIDYTIAAARD